jgi:dinuclear metal center YbgI/SA1388 family protein
MTTVADINNWINSIAPYDTMEEWDNSGFLVGDMQAPVRRCVLSLDATLAVVDFTVGMGAELLLTHHPLIFHGLRQVYTGTPVSELVQNGIALISAHTCFDKAPGGIGDRLAALLGLTNLTRSADGFLTVGRLSQAMSVDDFAAMAGEVLESDGLRYTDTEALIETVAVCGGAGGEFWRQAQQLADCYLTGEVRYHDLLEAAEAQYPVLAAGHYETEYAAFMTLKERLEQAFPDVEFICAPQKNPVLTV